MRRGLSFLLAALGVVAAAAPAFAQEPHPFGPYQAEIGRLPAPEWLQEGTRVYYEASGATQPRLVAGGGTVSASGSGVVTADFVSVVGSEVAVATRFHVRPNPSSPRELSFPVELGSTFPAAAGERWWVHPTVLKRAFDDCSAANPAVDWKATRGPYEVDGERIDAIQFVLGGRPRDFIRISLVYEEATGILLQSLQSVRQREGLSLHPREMYRYLGRRDRALPWSRGRPPDWLSKIESYTYEGSKILSMPGVPTQELPVRVTLERTRIGPNFIAYSVREDVTVTGMPQAPAEPVVRISGPTQVGGLWLPPLALKSLRQGQEIDRDEVTDTRTYVAHVGAGRHGREVVTVVEEGRGWSLAADYEIATGILLLSTGKDDALNLSAQVRFTGRTLDPRAKD